MGIEKWLRTPGRTLTVFLFLMLVLGGALGWLGWRLLEQDRALEKQRQQDRLEIAADGVAASIQQNFTDLEIYLDFIPGQNAKEPPDGVLVLQVNKHIVNVFPPGGLLFYPVIPAGKEPSEAPFAAGEALEYRRNDPARAAEVFRELARSPNPGVRAGALLRLGRNLRKTGRYDEALRAYGELAQLGQTDVLGLPAELTASEARCTVLETIGKREELRQEASLMYSALWSSRWRLLRPAWEFYVEEAQRWSNATLSKEGDHNALALSVAVESIYGLWMADPESRGRRIQSTGTGPVFFSWEGSSDRLAAVLAGPIYLNQRWTEVMRSRRVQGALIDAEGQVMIGSFSKSGSQAVRTAPIAGLPGTLSVTSTDGGAGEPGFAGRRRLLLSGFALLALVLLSGSYFIMRSIDRERTVARLQSEFVSAVSHEFRTPLTSLRQLSEMLSKGRIPTEDLRQKSYDILSSESERLQRLVESLLDFGRIEARAYRYRYENLDPVKWVGDLIAEFQEKAAAQGYRIELTLGKDYPLIHADREALSLALRNLLDNAVKYSPDCRMIWVEMAREQGRLAIRVRDLGIGIPASEQKDIFKKFVRGSASKTARVQGTGIGLAMAHHIVEAHDGEIRLESEAGRGSTFSILLPLERKS